MFTPAVSLRRCKEKIHVGAYQLLNRVEHVGFIFQRGL